MTRSAQFQIMRSDLRENERVRLIGSWKPQLKANSIQCGTRAGRTVGKGSLLGESAVSARPRRPGEMGFADLSR
jgi:hypothetical protein